MLLRLPGSRRRAAHAGGRCRRHLAPAAGLLVAGGQQLGLELAQQAQLALGLRLRRRVTAAHKAGGDGGDVGVARGRQPVLGRLGAAAVAQGIHLQAAKTAHVEGAGALRGVGAGEAWVREAGVRQAQAPGRARAAGASQAARRDERAVGTAGARRYDEAVRRRRYDEAVPRRRTSMEYTSPSPSCSCLMVEEPTWRSLPPLPASPVLPTLPHASSEAWLGDSFGASGSWRGGERRGGVPRAPGASGHASAAPLCPQLCCCCCCCCCRDCWRASWRMEAGRAWDRAPLPGLPERERPGRGGMGRGMWTSRLAWLEGEGVLSCRRGMGRRREEPVGPRAGERGPGPAARQRAGTSCRLRTGSRALTHHQLAAAGLGRTLAHARRGGRPPRRLAASLGAPPLPVGGQARLQRDARRAGGHVVVGQHAAGQRVAAAAGKMQGIRARRRGARRPGLQGLRKQGSPDGWADGGGEQACALAVVDSGHEAEGSSVHVRARLIQRQVHVAGVL